MAKKNSKFEKMKASLSKKVDASFQKLSQGSFPTYLDLPKGCSRWKPKSGKHLIDIIPYEATDKRPDFDEENPFEYKYEVPVHSRIGVNKEFFVCLRHFGQECPLCEYADSLMHSGRKEEAKLIKAKNRVLYNIVVLSDKDENKKGVQIWETSSWLVEEKILAIAEDPRDTEKKIQFTSPDETGKSIAFTMKMQGSGADTTVEMKGWRFVDRDEAIDDAYLEEAFILEDLIKTSDEEEMIKAVKGLKKIKHTDDDDEEEGTMGYADDDEDEKPKMKKDKVKKKPADDDDEDDEEDDEDEKPAPKKEKKENVIKKKPVDADEDEDDDEDEDEKPAPKKAGKGKKKPEPEPVDEDDDEEDEDEEEKKPARKAKPGLAKRKDKKEPEPVDDDEDDDDENDEDEKPAPKKTPAKGKGKKKPEPESEEDDDDDEEEEKPAPKKAGKGKGKNKCPADGAFGKDFEEFGYCSTCHLWGECEKANDELTSKKNKK